MTRGTLTVRSSFELGVFGWCEGAGVNFQCRGVLLIWIIEGQGPIALAVGAGGGCLDIFSFVYLFSLLSPSLGDGLIQTEILSQRGINPKHPSILF